MPRTLIVSQNMTLDGCVDMLDDWFDPSDQDGEVAAELARQRQTNDAVLLGRETFVAFRGFWPQQTDDTTGVSEHLDRVHKYVVSSTLTDPEWENSTIVSGDPVDAARELKAQDGGDIVVTGSVSLSHTLIAAGVVDELRLLIYPAVQGRGRRLAPDGHALPGLRLEESTAFSNGVVSSRYTIHE